MTKFLPVSQHYYLIHWANEVKVSIHRGDELVEPAEKDVVIEAFYVVAILKNPL